jgi:hypothetical protein
MWLNLTTKLRLRYQTRKCAPLDNDVWIKQRIQNNFNSVCYVNAKSVGVLHFANSMLRSCEARFSNPISIRRSKKNKV